MGLAHGICVQDTRKPDVCGIWRQAAIADALRAGAAAADHDLLTAFAAGTALPEIATRHQRSLTAIEARLERLGKITAEQRVTRNRFTAA